MKFSLIIPAYNEEKRIDSVVKSYLEYYVEKYGDDFELIVIIDGVDNTLGICSEYVALSPNLRVDYSRNPLGKGAAVMRGFRLAKGGMIGFTDADDSVSVEEFDKLIEMDVDCAIASRKLLSSQILKNQPFARRFSSGVFNVFVNLLFDLSVSDTQCGAKVFKRGVIEAILDEMISTGFEFDVELLWRVKRKKFDVKEVSIVWAHNDDSSFSLMEAPKMFLALLKLRLGH